MRRLDLEFQPAPGSPIAWSLLTLGCAVLAAMLLIEQHLQDEQADLQARVHLLEQQLGRRPVSAAPLSSAASREQAEQLAQMRSVSQQLQRPWQQLFAMLEGMPQEDVALLSLTPDARKGQVRIAAEARNLEAMLQYHQRLERSEELRDVSLLNHEVVTGQPEHPVRFNLTATWETGHARP
ncbi:MULTISPECIES: pilus assembly protein [Pseudomonas]|uniref:Pilus assembly protein n=1 Tax=Pseudomonas guariconensis TaxID=1288410 RepID=A0AAX0VX15_9PSED|nr:MULTISPECIES: pilus assembly protein [Pseudomonas]MDM9593967.1 pilus assembly protein [Pseudomonas guariconensis]MDM9606794.1 pilus assembly protein [Pseudomonas guariconensis]MDM9611750.1 pilus assembly protein [Pseudomonas guariconensis]PLV19225.1 pilus assembly protein [Pseudomonas guariconensis]PLV25251.1 pilus assembly protein [Pseudomonas guariconensis]